MRHVVSVSAVSLSAVLWSGMAHAQNISVETLGSAQNYQTGLLSQSNGGLDSALWQGTSAARASLLLLDVAGAITHPLTADLIRAAVLSEGVPPASQDRDIFTNYERHRLEVIMRLVDQNALSRFIDSNPDLERTPETRVNIALIEGNYETPCQISDTISQGRADPYWVRLRAFCHAIRDQIPATELTLNLLKNSGFEDPTYFALMERYIGVSSQKIENIASDDPLINALVHLTDLDVGQNSELTGGHYAAQALNADLPREQRLEAMFAAGYHLTDENIDQILKGLAYDPDHEELSLTSDFEAILGADAPLSLGRLHNLIKGAPGSDEAGQALSVFLERSQKMGGMARFINYFTNDIRLTPAQTRLQYGSDVFTQAAIQNKDLLTLREFYQDSADDPELRARLALISDALGNGFILGELGADIDGRLEAGGSPRAIRDMWVALAMGANLSDQALSVLQNLEGDRQTTQGRKPAQGLDGLIIAMELAAERGSRAELALLAASALGNAGAAGLDDLSLYRIIKALYQGGLSDYAGRLAAEDFARFLDK